MSWREVVEAGIGAVLRALEATERGAAPATNVTVTIGPGSAPLVVGPSAERSPLVGPAEIVSVAPPPRDAWDDRGWRVSRSGGTDVYEGEYELSRAGRRVRFRGRVVVTGLEVNAYIADPPSVLRKHPKGACFQLSKLPWFRVHWHRPAANVDDAILYVERVLYEALN